MAMQRPSGIESVWRKPLHRIVTVALGVASLCAMGFPINARGDEQTGATARAFSVGRTVDAEQLSRVRGGASVPDLTHTAQLGVILWDEARPPVHPVRNAGMGQAQSVTASAHVVVK